MLMAAGLNFGTPTPGFLPRVEGCGFVWSPFISTKRTYPYAYGRAAVCADLQGKVKPEVLGETGHAQTFSRSLDDPAQFSLA